MNVNIVECDFAERDPGMCQCGGGPTLDILKDIQKAYEDRMQLIERVGGSNKLQKQVEVLRSWVSDLVGQNTLLARAVEELEAEATTRLLLERRRHSEMVTELNLERAALRRRLARKDSDLRGLVEVLRRLREFDYCTLDGIHFFERSKKKIVCRSVNDLTIINEALQKENIAKDREIQKLNKDVQQYEQAIMNLRGELSLSKYHTPDVSKKDAEVMAGMCCTGAECGDWEPVKDITALIREETLKYQERLQKMEDNLKNSSKSVHALRKANIVLGEESAALRRLCAALDEQARAAAARAHFKDDIIREIRRQLKQAKAKVLTTSRSCQIITSTPNISNVPEAYEECTSDISVIEPPLSPSIAISDNSIAELERTFLKSRRCFQDVFYKGSRRSVQIQVPEKTEKEINVDGLSVSGISNVVENQDVEEQTTNRLETACLSQEISSKSQDSMKNSICKEHQDSVADSASGSCDTSRAQYYHNKLLATMQILENKEETVRVQSESLSVAEARIASLTARISELRRDVERKDRELQSFYKLAEEREITKTDVSITAMTQENDQQNVINTLQDNLAVIEELYRECFYETAKQECLIEMLRASCLDVRATDTQKAAHIHRLQAVIHDQRCSLDRCQDIAHEVETLKMEISNFLNSSNNDSGMWDSTGRSDVSVTSGVGVGEDLRDIMDHLLRLRGLLDSGCICGLEEENNRLRKNNDTLQLQVGELRQRVSELEASLSSREEKDLFYQQQIHDGEKELHSIRKQLAAVEESKCKQSTSCDALALQLQQMEALLKEKTSELVQVKQQCELHESAARCLTEQLARDNRLGDETGAARAVGCRARLAASECRARSLEAELDQLRVCYRQKACAADQLRAQLEEAQRRGAALCGTAKAALDAVGTWSRKHRHKRRELEDIIKEKESIISSLQQRIEQRQNESRISNSEEPTCSKCVRRDYVLPSFSSARARREQCVGTSESERTSCSSAPVPPRRARRKSSLCSDKHSCSCSASPPAAGSTPRVSGHTLHHVNRCEASCVRLHTMPREASPTADLLDRVEQLAAALADGRRRWAQHR